MRIMMLVRGMVESGGVTDLARPLPAIDPFSTCRVAAAGEHWTARRILRVRADRGFSRRAGSAQLD